MARTSFCDESGYTGPNLLDEQGFCVYASVALPHELAVELAARLRSDFQISSKGLKFENFFHRSGT